MSAVVGRFSNRIGDPTLAARLARELRGDVLFDAFSRGRYSTDASHYQIEPIGVVVPHNEEDAVLALEIAMEEGVAVLPRGAGTSQCGQTVGEALVIDVSKHLDRIVDLDTGARRAVVQPGIVLDVLNAALKPHGLHYPVDVSTSSRATLGGMTGNNSCGARSLRYGTMRDNVVGIDATLADGRAMYFGELGELAEPSAEPARTLLDIGRREAEEIAARFPLVQRRVGGYNIDALTRGYDSNLAHLLVGSEGTLAFSRRIHLKLHPLPAHRALGVCHFPTFYSAMDATRHIVELGPSAVELVDRTMLDLSRDIPAFRRTVDDFVRGEPEALLLVEFAGADHGEQLRGVKRLEELMADLGFPDSVVNVASPAFQKDIWEVRKAGLNIMMSMKGDGKPISFIEDCAVRLEDLAEYTDRLTQVFAKHGTTGTWYAHASVGCLHVRPVLNMKQATGATTMRAIAEEAFEMVREYKGSHSGEHGDGLVRSEFHEAMFGPRMTASFAEIKKLFDPRGLLNPGKIVDPPRMDDRTLFRFKPDYRIQKLDTGLDWSDWDGFGGAVEMCNNNGACRKATGGVMCPSYRVTGDERHLTRGRANSLRLAISGQLGPDALLSAGMRETMALCVGCKGCRRECPTGVDMARMKIEVLHQQVQRHGLSARDRLIAYLPRYAPTLSKLGPLANAGMSLPGIPALAEKLLGLSRQRSLPAWHRHPFRATRSGTDKGEREVVLLPDTFNTWFEPENLRAAVRVLDAAGYRVRVASNGSSRPLCCGRTFLAAGLIDEARVEAKRTLLALTPYLEAGIPIVGLEPSCLLTLRDEWTAMLPGNQLAGVPEQSFLFEEFLAAETKSGRCELSLAPMRKSALLHGHCHQKAFGAMPSVHAVLNLIPELEVVNVESSCCGMAGAFGFAAETYAVSLQMAELNLAPAVRESHPDSLIVADGTSCRHQIEDTTSRQALHCARLLDMALTGDRRRK